MSRSPSESKHAVSASFEIHTWLSYLDGWPRIRVLQPARMLHPQKLGQVSTHTEPGAPPGAPKGAPRGGLQILFGALGFKLRALGLRSPLGCPPKWEMSFLFHLPFPVPTA
jgi:hypothetical protein